MVDLAHGDGEEERGDSRDQKCPSAAVGNPARYPKN